MHDPTEPYRRAEMARLDRERSPRERLEAEHGQVWDTEELTRDFTVQSFLAPFVLVTRKADGVQGTMHFQPSPRFYFAFQVTP